MTTRFAKAPMPGWTRWEKTWEPQRFTSTAPRSSDQSSPEFHEVKTPVGSGMPASPWPATPTSMSSSVNAGNPRNSTEPRVRPPFNVNGGATLNTSPLAENRAADAGRSTIGLGPDGDSLATRVAWSFVGVAPSHPATPGTAPNSTALLGQGVGSSRLSLRRQVGQPYAIPVMVGDTRVPADPLRMSDRSLSAPMTASLPVVRAKSAAAWTFGPIDPAGNQGGR